MLILLERDYYTSSIAIKITGRENSPHTATITVAMIAISTNLQHDNTTSWQQPLATLLLRDNTPTVVAWDLC